MMIFKNSMRAPDDEDELPNAKGSQNQRFTIARTHFNRLEEEYVCLPS